MKKFSKIQLLIVISLILGGVAFYFFRDQPAQVALYSPSYTPDGFNKIIPAKAENYTRVYQIEYKNSQGQSFYFLQQPVDDGKSVCAKAKESDDVTEFKYLDIEGAQEACRYTITSKNNESREIYVWEEYDLLFGFIVREKIISEDELLNLAERITLDVVDAKYDN